MKLFKTKTAEEYKNIGIREFQNKNYPKAEKCFTKAIQLDNCSAELFLWRAKSRIAFGEIDGAQNDLTESEKHVDSKSNDEALSKYYSDVNEVHIKCLEYPLRNVIPVLNQAHKFLADTEMEMPDLFNGKSSFEIAKEYQYKGNYQKAIRNFNLAIEDSPENKDYIFERGLTYLKIKKLPNAMADFTKALELDDKNKDVWVLRGFLRYLVTDNDGARYDFKKAIDLEEEHKKLIENLFLTSDDKPSINALLDKNRVLLSEPKIDLVEIINYIVQIRQQFSLLPSLMEVLTQTAINKVQTYQYEAAKEDFKTILHFSPKNGLATYGLGKSMKELSDPGFKEKLQEAVTYGIPVGARDFLTDSEVAQLIQEHHSEKQIESHKQRRMVGNNSTNSHESGDSQAIDINEFIYNGSIWEIKYKGEQFIVKDRIGMKYIAMLLAKPNTSIPVRSMVPQENLSTEEWGEREEQVIELFENTDEEQIINVVKNMNMPIQLTYIDTIKEYVIKLKEIKDLIVINNESGNLETVEALEKGEKELKNKIREFYGRGERSADDEKARKGVGKAISDAIKEIAKVNSNMATYLKKNLIMHSMNPQYIEQEGIKWKIV